MEEDEASCWAILVVLELGRGGLESGVWEKEGFRDGSELEDRGEWDSASLSPLDNCGVGFSEYGRVR